MIWCMRRAEALMPTLMPTRATLGDTKYKQIIFEGYKLMGRGGAHETDPYPNS